MKITSPVFENEQLIPGRYSCDGNNVNPPLIFSELPEDTRSLALTVIDLDAESGPFAHWLVWNINPATTRIDEDKAPAGTVQGNNDFDVFGYRGPCPPSGIHRYVFKLYALKDMLKVSSGATLHQLETAMEDQIIDTAELTGAYDGGFED